MDLIKNLLVLGPKKERPKLYFQGLHAYIEVREEGDEKVLKCYDSTCGAKAKLSLLSFIHLDKGQHTCSQKHRKMVERVIKEINNSYEGEVCNMPGDFVEEVLFPKNYKITLRISEYQPQLILEKFHWRDGNLPQSLRETFLASSVISFNYREFLTLIFGTKNISKKYSKEAEVAFVHVLSNVSVHPFKQIIIFSMKVKGNIFPLALAISTANNELEVFEEMLTSLKKLFPDFQPKKWFCEFDPNKWFVLKRCFRGCQVLGSRYDFCLSLEKVIEKIPVLKERYIPGSEEEVNILLRKFMALCVLPNKEVHWSLSVIETIINAKSFLRVQKNALNKFLRYFKRFWMTEIEPEGFSIGDQTDAGIELWDTIFHRIQMDLSGCKNMFDTLERIFETHLKKDGSFYSKATVHNGLKCVRQQNILRYFLEVNHGVKSAIIALEEVAKRNFLYFEDASIETCARDEIDETGLYTCTICLRKSPELAANRCGHVFCRTCWTAVDKCPMCRHDKIDLRTIYLQPMSNDEIDEFQKTIPSTHVVVSNVFSEGQNTFFTEAR